MKNEQTARPHSLTIDDRCRATLTGVEDVDCFSDDMAVITTIQGTLTVTGTALKVARLDLESGEVALEGQIDSIEYGAVRKTGLMSRIFR